MATIKSYSDLQQSRKLAEILPLESADMHYCLEKRGVATGYEIGITPYIKAKSFIGKCNIIDVQPSWSLAALLGVLPYPFLSELSNGIWKCGCYPSGICNYVTADSPIDACYEMVIHLHELKML